MEEWAKVIVGGVIGAVGLAVAAFATGWFGYASKNEELHVHLVEIAFGILEADPKQGVSPARGWAIEVIENNSGVKFSDEDRAALLHQPIESSGLAWKKDFFAVPLNGDLKEFFRKWSEQQDKGAPVK